MLGVRRGACVGRRSPGQPNAAPGGPVRPRGARALRSGRMRIRRTAAAALLVSTLLVGCGSTDGTGDEATDPPTGEPSTAPTSAGPTPIPGEPGDNATDEPSPGPGDLPGEPVEGGIPLEGADLGVVGVVAGDVLNVREGPGVDFRSLARLEPLATGLVATGHNRRLPDGGQWAQVTVDGTTGWVNARYVTHPGQVTDITSELGELPSAPTLEEVATLVAEQRALDGPPPTVTVADGPSEGDLGEIVVDVVGYADDALAGERLHVLAVPGEAGWTVRTVEATLLCARGVSEGLCV